MIARLLMSRKFAPLFWCQFFAAFNDTYLKAAVTFLVVFSLPPAYSRPLTLVATILMTGPSFLLSGLGGELADRYDKAIVARWLKLAEFGAVAIACLGFLLPSIPLLFVALGLFGSLSALFGPIKYGILPDHVERQQLASANALVETASFLAAIFGATIAALSSNEGHGDPRWPAALTLLFAGLAYLSARLIPPTGEGAPDLAIDANVLRSTFRLIAYLRADMRLWHGSIIVSLFWLFAIVIYTLLTPVVALALHGDELVFQVYNTLFAIGIVLGSGFASWLVAGRTITLPAVFAAFAIGIISLDLSIAVPTNGAHAPLLGVFAYFTTWRAYHVGLDLFLIAFVGGLFIVPTFAAVQTWAPGAQRARVVGAVNVMNSLFMVIGLLATIAMESAGASFSRIFLALAAFSLCATVWIFWALPTNPLRDLGAIAFRLLFRMEVEGLENIAKAGPSPVIVLHRMSPLEAGIAFAILDNDPVFTIDRTFVHKRWVKPFVRYVNVLPLDTTRALATRRLIRAAKNGRAVVVPSVECTNRTGRYEEVHDGLGFIADKSDEPVVPVYIEGAERSRFSCLADAAEVPRKLFPRIKVTILEPRHIALPADMKGRVRRRAARDALLAIMSARPGSPAPASPDLNMAAR